MDLSPPLPPPSPTPSPPSFFRTFPVITLAIVGILATAFLLVGYYAFVIKCCLHWHRRRRRNSASFSGDAGNELNKNGLDEALIRSIPVIKFRRLTEQDRENNGSSNEMKAEQPSEYSYECAVCLSEFEDGEKLRVIPICCHAFHIDCIDVWLQSSANCPLCRWGISPSSILCNNNNHNHDRIFSYPPPPPPPPPPHCNDGSSDNFSGSDEDYVVIEIQGNNLDKPRMVNSSQSPIRVSPRKGKRGKKLELACSIGDELIDMREKDREFDVAQPVRRSISMDLTSEREFCIEIQGNSTEQCGEIDNSSRTLDCNTSSTSRVRRSIFSFGYGRSSRRSVQPVHLDP